MVRLRGIEPTHAVAQGTASQVQVKLSLKIKMVRLRGIEPPHAVPETTALSTELQAQIYHTIIA